MGSDVSLDTRVWRSVGLAVRKGKWQEGEVNKDKVKPGRMTYNPPGGTLGLTSVCHWNLGDLLLPPTLQRMIREICRTGRLHHDVAHKPGPELGEAEGGNLVESELHRSGWVAQGRKVSRQVGWLRHCL